MLIREVSRKTGVSVRSIRYYEAKGLIDVNRLANGYRDYDESIIDRIKTIQFYLGLGLTTEHIVQIIQCPTSGHKPMCKEAYRLYQIKLEEINRQLVLLNAIKSKLQERITQMENYMQ